MKLLAAGMVSVMVSAAMMTGCGPGLSHREAKAPEQQPLDVFNAMDAELSRAIVGTTTVTSGEALPLPETRLAMASTREPVVAAAPTWGASGETMGQAEAAGVAPAAEAPAPAATNDFDMHPYEGSEHGSFDQHPYE